MCPEFVSTEFFPGANFEKTKEIIARTCGMHIFIGREVECGPYAKEPSELGPIVHMVGSYVLDQKVQFVGGETIGTDKTPIGTISLDRSRVGSNLDQVIRIIVD